MCATAVWKDHPLRFFNLCFLKVNIKFNKVNIKFDLNCVLGLYCEFGFYYINGSF